MHVIKLLHVQHTVSSDNILNPRMMIDSSEMITNGDSCDTMRVEKICIDPNGTVHETNID
jgi:hypothetical protein